MRLLPCLTGLLLITSAAAAQPANYNAGPGPSYDPGSQPMPGPGGDVGQGGPGQGGPGYGPGPEGPGGQGPQAGPGGAPHGGMQRPRVPFAQRFESANVTHDGRLTLEQARAGHMGMIAHNFEQIDADHKGYVTVQDVHAWHRARHQAQMAQQQQPPAQ